MKMKIVLLLLVWIADDAVAQTTVLDPVTWQTMNLKGRVKTVLEREARGDKSSDALKDTIIWTATKYEFDESGKLKSKLFLKAASNGFFAATEQHFYSYSGQNQVSKIEEIDSTDKVIGTVEATGYKSDGLITSSVSKKSRWIIKDEYDYNTANNLAKITQTSGWNGTAEPLKNKSYYYNQQGRVSAIVDDQNRDSVVFVYNTQQQIVEKKRFARDIKTATFSYDLQGNVLKENGPFDCMYIGDHYYEYTYDEKGNWTTRKFAHQKGYSEKNTFRQITYY